MKKKILFLIAFALLITNIQLFAQTATPPAAGDGTEGNPYQIAALDNLYWLTQNSAQWDKHYIQTADIDASSTNTWDIGDHDGDAGTPDAAMGFSPIGNSMGVSHFTGSYNGNGFTIDGLFINRPTLNNIAFFGWAQDAILENINLTNVDITGNSTAGLTTVADNSTVNATFCSGNITSVHAAAGLITSINNNSVITNSSSNCTVSSPGDYVAGFAFSVMNSSVVSKCFSQGTVSGNNSVGGFVGKLDYYGNVNNCYSFVDVTGNAFVGGFCGAIGANGTSSVENCYSAGTVSASSDVGGLVGRNYAGTITNSFWDTDIYVQDNGSGTGLTTEQMQQICTYYDAGWDLTDESDNGSDDIWGMNPAENGGYPFFSWQDYTPSETTCGCGNPMAGEGTVDNPFEVAALEDLRYLSENSCIWNKHYIQTADIEASETSTWNSGAGFSPVGDDLTLFTGSYNGKGNTINALYINLPAGNKVGLFGIIEDAAIDSLGLTNIEITGQYNIGPFAGLLRGSSSVSNSFSSGNIYGENGLGGLVAWLSSSNSVSNCYSLTNVHGTGNAIGGLVGIINSSSASVSNSYCAGSVEGLTNIGGLIGTNGNNAPVLNSFWDTETSGQATSTGGVGLTTEQMQTLCTYIDGTYAAWDFMVETDNGTDDIWGLNASENGGYPFLAWQGYSHTEACNTVQVSQVNDEAIQVYPNPTDGKLTVSINNNNATELQIIDVTGKQLMKEKFDTNQFQVDISRLNHGIYFLRINSDRLIYTERIIKK